MTHGDTAHLFNVMAPCVTSDMKVSQTNSFMQAGVKEALDSIGDLKDPGPDGMPSIFYKRLWEVVGSKVPEEVMSVF